MFSYSKYRFPELAEKKRKRFLKGISLFLFLVILVLVCVSLLPRNSRFLINDVRVSGNSIESSEDLSQFVKGGVIGNYYKIIPKNNYFFYPRKTIEKALLQEFKRLESAVLSYDGAGVLALDVRERRPYWLWCAEPRCFFMDSNGFIFAKGPNFSGNVFFRASGGISIASSTDPIGFRFAWRYSIAQIEELISNLAKLNFEAVSILINADNDAFLTLTDGTVLKFSPDKALSESYLDLEDAIASGLLNREKRFEYIDLRFSDKVFYKEAIEG